MACADVAMTKRKAAQINLIIVSSYVSFQEWISFKAILRSFQSAIVVKGLIGEHDADGHRRLAEV